MSRDRWVGGGVPPGCCTDSIPDILCLLPDGCCELSQLLTLLTNAFQQGVCGALCHIHSLDNGICMPPSLELCHAPGLGAPLCLGESMFLEALYVPLSVFSSGPLLCGCHDDYQHLCLL